MYITDPFEFNFINNPIIKNKGINIIIKNIENVKSKNLFEII